MGMHYGGRLKRSSRMRRHSNVLWLLAFVGDPKFKQMRQGPVRDAKSDAI